MDTWDFETSGVERHVRDDSTEEVEDSPGARTRRKTDKRKDIAQDDSDGRSSEGPLGEIRSRLRLDLSERKEQEKSDITHTTNSNR